MLESRANTWYGSAGSGSRRCDAHVVLLVHGHHLGVLAHAASWSNARPDSSVAREIALVGSQR